MYQNDSVGTETGYEKYLRVYVTISICRKFRFIRENEDGLEGHLEFKRFDARRSTLGTFGRWKNKNYFSSSTILVKLRISARTSACGHNGNRDVVFVRESRTRVYLPSIYVDGQRGATAGKSAEPEGCDES